MEGGGLVEGLDGGEGGVGLFLGAFVGVEDAGADLEGGAGVDLGEESFGDDLLGVLEERVGASDGDEDAFAFGGAVGLVESDGPPGVGGAEDEHVVGLVRIELDGGRVVDFLAGGAVVGEEARDAPGRGEEGECECGGGERAAAGGGHVGLLRGVFVFWMVADCGAMRA